MPELQNRRLKVLVLTHFFPSAAAPGSGSFVKEQCDALAQHCDITVVTGRRDLTSRTEETAPNGVRVISVPLVAPRTLPSAARVAATIPSYTHTVISELESISPRVDLIHAHFALPDGVTAVRTGSKTGVPVVVTLHGSDFNRQMHRPLVGGFVAHKIARAAGIIGVSRQIAEGYAALVPHAAERVQFIPNGYDSELICYKPKPADGPFLFIGALKSVKQPLVLIEAFARIASHTPRDLVIIGEGPLRAEVEHAITAHGLADRVRLLGRVDHDLLPPHLRQAVALVLPSRSEGMPLVVIESLASGTPVVASAVGAIPDLVSPGESGLLVVAGDVEGLAAAMLQAGETAWDPERIYRDAPVIDWAENARRVTELYRRILTR